MKKKIKKNTVLWTEGVFSTHVSCSLLVQKYNCNLYIFSQSIIVQSTASLHFTLIALARNFNQ